MTALFAAPRAFPHVVTKLQCLICLKKIAEYVEDNQFNYTGTKIKVN